MGKLMSSDVKEHELNRKNSTVQPKESIICVDLPCPLIMVGLWYNWTTGPWKWIWQQASMSLTINFACCCETERKEVANLSYNALQTGKDISADVPRSRGENTGKDLHSESLD